MLDHLLNNTSLNKEQMFTLAGLMSKLLAKLPIDSDLTPEVLRMRGKVHKRMHAHLAGVFGATLKDEHLGRASQGGLPSLPAAAWSRSNTTRSPMTPTQDAPSASPLHQKVIEELSPDQLFQKQLVSMGLNLNRRLVDVDTAVLHHLYPALHQSKAKPAQDAQLINSYLPEKATIAKRIVELLHQHHKLQRRRVAMNDERTLERQFLLKYMEMADTESEEEEDDAVDQNDDPAMKVVEYYRQVVARFTENPGG